MLSLFGAAAVLSGCDGRGPDEHLFAGPAMGSQYAVKVVGALDEEARAAAAEAIEKALDTVNTKMSTYRPDSELSRFNAHADTTPFPISRETEAVFRIAQQVSAESGGAFDVTVGPLVDAWGFGPARPEAPPSDDEIAALLERVGHEQLELSEGAIAKRHPEAACDLSGVAKGYAADLVAEALAALGHRNFLVEVGGEIRASGVNARGGPWRIAIEQPDPSRRAIQRVVPLRDLAMATSGDYRNFYERDGKRYSHTIDPRTGRPVDHHLASATVVHEGCGWADAYATALMALGPEEGRAFAEAQGLAALLLVYDEAGGVEEWMSPAFAELLDAE